MKAIRIGCLLSIVPCLLLLTGCTTPHNFPKDAAIIGASGVSGVWGHGEIKGVVLTGKAATADNVAAAAAALPNVLK
jgi:hypothetical protein